MTPAGPTDAPGHEAFASFDPRYVVERELGRGAMGRVFLARDLRLDRLVAIKALAPGLQDAIDLRRLEQEARAAGSLNHPNIVAVHDIGTSDGRPFIVSEYLRGETLRQKLEAGPLPWAQALDFGLQLARGLTAAHERGIVHRDLKPENLFVTEDGWLKILDFGIAKREAQTGPEADTPQRLTPPQLEALHSALPPMTSPGEILGTVGYMSPEQVLGQPADARSDIFAFGTILYEMLSGARAFHRERSAATSFAILRDEPSPLPETVPARLREAVARCLRKVPAQRFASARELATALDELRPTGEMPAVGHSSGSRRWLIAVVALSLALASAGGFTAWKIAHRAPPSFRQLTFHPGAVWSARFGPDGKQVFYSAAWDAKMPKLFVTTPGNPEPRKLDLPDAHLFAVSRTGNLAFALRPRFAVSSFAGELAVSMPGGEIRRQGFEADGAEFAPDGSLAVVRQVAGHSQLELPIGKVIATSAGLISSPRISPSGDRIAFIDHPEREDDAGEIVIRDVAGGVRTISRGWRSIHGLAWAPSAEELWFTAVPAGQAGAQMALWAASLTGRTRQLLQVGGDLKLEDVSPDGRLLVTQPQRRLNATVMKWDGTGYVHRDVSSFDRSFIEDIDSNGKDILVTVDGAATGSAYSVYLRPTDGSTARSLGEGRGIAISPMGTFALTASMGAEGPLSLVPVGGGRPTSIDVGDLTVTRGRFLPDGNHVVLLAHQPGHAHRLYKMGIDGQKPTPISSDGIPVGWMSVSPAGVQVAVGDRDSNPFLVDSTTGNTRILPGSTRGEVPLAWPNPSTLLVGRFPSPVISVYSVDPASGSRVAFLQIASPDPNAFLITRAFGSSDAKTIAYSYVTISGSLFSLDGVH
jgi:WD40 repeat protein